jgi:hypothetical protein
MTSILEQAVRNALVPIYIEKDIFGAEEVLSKKNMEFLIKGMVQVIKRQLKIKEVV